MKNKIKFYKQALGWIKQAGPVEPGVSTDGTMYDEYDRTRKDVAPPQNDNVSTAGKVGRVIQYGSDALPMLFMDAHPSANDALTGVLLDQFKAEQYGRGIRIPGESARAPFNHKVLTKVLPGIGVVADPLAAIYHYQLGNNEKMFIPKMINYGEMGGDAALLLGDTSYLASQILRHNSPMWLNRFGAASMRWSGPLAGYMALWDVGNAYRKELDRELGESVAREQDRQRAQNLMSGLSNRRLYEQSLESHKQNVHDMKDLLPNEMLDALNENAGYEKAMATQLAVGENGLWRSATRPRIEDGVYLPEDTANKIDRTIHAPEGTTNQVVATVTSRPDAMNPSAVPTGELMTVDFSGSRPQITQRTGKRPESQYKYDYSILPAPNRIMAGHRSDYQSEDMVATGIKQYDDSMNITPAVWQDQVGNVYTFDPEYYAAEMQNLKANNPKDMFAYWIRPAIPDYSRKAREQDEAARAYFSKLRQEEIQRLHLDDPAVQREIKRKNDNFEWQVGILRILKDIEEQERMQEEWDEQKEDLKPLAVPMSRGGKGLDISTPSAFGKSLSDILNDPKSNMGL